MLSPQSTIHGVMTAVKMNESTSMVTNPNVNMSTRFLLPNQNEEDRAHRDLQRAVAPEQRPVDFRRRVAQHHSSELISERLCDMRERLTRVLHDSINRGKALRRREPHAQGGHHPCAQQGYGQSLRSFHGIFRVGCLLW